ncbi:FtsK/SpoIIIE domain-containing protein [Nonomuraea sp. SYSU D8015]|uniref:FtsK/SpoIIIE domain-containing protein n=1 Tax=Nonomuraea sp. SYSU D8015 TaxID=2593644 RepID=UPI001CB6DA79|nr:FtsK/SpoIIIE domain-containing protein [Nonomuraea sp. SYSU D8015]
MRIMLTVLGGQGDRDVVIDGDDDATVAKVSEALSDHGPLAKVVRLPRARAPYGMSADGIHVPPPRRPERAHLPGGQEPVMWRDGRPLDPRARASSVLRDGDKVTLDPKLARATVVEEPGGVAEVRVVGGPAAGAVHRLGLGAHIIGSDPMCAIAAADPALAPEAVTVRVTPDAITVARTWREPGEAPKLKLKGRWAEEVAELTARTAEREAAELAAGYGEAPELDGRPFTEPVEWPDQAVLTCGSSVFVLTSIEPKDAHLAPRSEGGMAYNRPPRLRRPEPERKFVKPKEPTRNEGLRLQLLAALLPAALGLTLAIALGQWYYLLIAFMTPIIMIGQWWSDRRHGKKQHKKAIKEYKERLQKYDEAVEGARVIDEAARRADAPDPAQVLLTATGPRRRLWERRIHDSDALRLRVGLADLPANLELSEEQGGPIDPPICRSVPVALPMRRLGVAGLTGPRAAATGLASWLIAQAATLHSPRDLAIVVVSAHADAESRWGWMRWLPHCAPRAGEECVALFGTDPDSAARRVSELAALIDERQNTKIPELGKIPTGWDDLGGSEKPTFSSYDVRPHDVLVILDGAQVLRGLPNMPQVLRQGPRSGVYTLALDDDQRLLPEECQTVAACGGDGLVRLRGGGLDVIGPVLGDFVSAAWCDRLARALAPIRDVSRDDPAGNLPGAVRLLDLMRMPSPSGKELAARWGDRGSTSALIGVGPEGPFSVDLRLDGPHGLIAGTTGAGKSELLQTLICALAVANRPDQLTFVLIDYKGGAAFKECVRLPHTVGMVSDLDGHLTQRALDSLAAEIRRRERLLMQAGAKDIDDYAGAVPLPRLVLIIDEFAALVAELPDFVTGLVDIARRGRSLGIHLILATQRPAGVVTADIQANTSLRIALRVTEPSESTDVIDLPDAAHISKSTPGRCYVRSGVGAATAVQTARVGGRSPAASGALEASGGNVRVVDVAWRSLGKPLPRPPEPEEESTVTDLTLVADALIEAAQLTGVPAQPSPWLDPLPTHFVLDLPTPASVPEPPPNTASAPGSAGDIPAIASNPPETTGNTPAIASAPPGTTGNTPAIASDPPRTTGNTPAIASGPLGFAGNASGIDVGAFGSGSKQAGTTSASSGAAEGVAGVVPLGGAGDGRGESGDGSVSDSSRSGDARRPGSRSEASDADGAAPRSAGSHASGATPVHASGVPFRGNPLQPRVKGSGQPALEDSGHQGNVSAGVVPSTGFGPVPPPGSTALPPSGFGAAPPEEPDMSPLAGQEMAHSAGPDMSRPAEPDGPHPAGTGVSHPAGSDPSSPAGQVGTPGPFHPAGSNAYPPTGLGARLPAGPDARPLAGPGAHPPAGPDTRPLAGPGAHPPAGPDTRPLAAPGAHPPAGPGAPPPAGVGAYSSDSSVQVDGAPFGGSDRSRGSRAGGAPSSDSGVSAGGAFVEVAPLPFGLTDRPWAQDRKPLALDLAHGGHLLIAGAARSGRSTALRTIAGSIAAHTSPSDVHLHAVDCGSGALLPLVAMPHCGAVVTRDQLDRVERLLTRLRAEIGRRQQLLAEAGHASLAEYRQAGHRLPWLVFMLDRWEGFVAAFESYDYGRLIEALLQLLREGAAVGFRGVVTSDRSGLLGQVSTVFDERLLLRLSDGADYGLAGFPLKGLPSSMPAGRALSMGEHGVVEHHIALLAADPSGPAQVAALQSLARQAAAAGEDEAGRPRPRRQGPAHEDGTPLGRGAWRWSGEPPLRVDALPMRITAAQTLELDPSFVPPSPLWALIGAGGDALAPLGLDLLAHGPGAVIAGPARSGRSSALLTAAHSLIDRGTPVIAIAPRRSPLRDLDGALAVLDGNAANLLELVADQHHYVVLVDDAELINPDSPLGTALEEVLRSGRDGDHGLLIAGTTGDLAVAYRGFVAETRKARTGLLLAVQGQNDGDIFTIRLPRGAAGGPPGRGLLVTTGNITPVQAALPDNA